MSPKDFRKISHPEPELSTNEVSGDKWMEARTEVQTASPRLDTQGGLVEN